MRGDASARRVSPKTRLAPLFVGAPADKRLLQSHSLPRFELQTPMTSEVRRRAPEMQVETMTHSMSLSFSTPSFPSTALRQSHSGQLLLPSPTPLSQPLSRSHDSELSLSGSKLSRKSAEGRDEAEGRRKKHAAQSEEDFALKKMKQEMQGTLLDVCESLLQDVEKRQPYTALPGEDPRVERCMEGERQGLKLALAKRMMHELVRSRGQPVSPKLQSELIEQASRFCELRRQVTINDLGYKGQYKGWRPATHHRTRSGRFCSPSASMISPNTAPAWEDEPPVEEASPQRDPPGSLDRAARSGKERQKKQHNTLPTIQPPSGPFKVRDSLSIIATDEIPPGPFVDKREIEMYRHVTFR
jgi:hypothetical protein